MVICNPTLPNAPRERKPTSGAPVVLLASYRPKPQSSAADTPTPLNIEAYRAFRDESPDRPTADDRLRFSQCQPGAAIRARLNATGAA